MNWKDNVLEIVGGICTELDKKWKDDFTRTIGLIQAIINIVIKWNVQTFNDLRDNIETTLWREKEVLQILSIIKKFWYLNNENKFQELDTSYHKIKGNTCESFEEKMKTFDETTEELCYTYEYKYKDISWSEKTFCIHFLEQGEYIIDLWNWRISERKTIERFRKDLLTILGFNINDEIKSNEWNIWAIYHQDNQWEYYLQPLRLLKNRRYS